MPMRTILATALTRERSWITGECRCDGCADFRIWILEPVASCFTYPAGGLETAYPSRARVCRPLTKASRPASFSNSETVAPPVVSSRSLLSRGS